MSRTSLSRRVAGPFVRLGLAAVLGWVGPSGVRAQAPAPVTPAPRYAAPAYAAPAYAPPAPRWVAPAPAYAVPSPATAAPADPPAGRDYDAYAQALFGGG